ncbi:MAG: LysR family transcriptional regulator [Massiliimalia sp.]
MTLRHLKIFVVVFQTESVTQASKLLCMTQPAVTRAIKEIEGYYGVCLFDRIHHRLMVTESGKMLYTYAIHILDSFDQLEKNLRNWENLGTLRIGTTVTIGNLLLPKALSFFKRDYPQLQVKAKVATGSVLQQDLINNQLDFVVMEGKPVYKELMVKKIAQDRLVLILPPDDPRKQKKQLFLKDFQNDAFILRDEGSMSRVLIDHVFALHQIPLIPFMESISTQAIIRAVHEGLGISFLPEHLAAEPIAAGLVSTAELVDENFVRENYVVWHKQKFLTQSAQRLIDYFCNLSYGTEESKK